jgi:hypothetical protein
MNSAELDFGQNTPDTLLIEQCLLVQVDTGRTYSGEADICLLIRSLLTLPRRGAAPGRLADSTNRTVSSTEAPFVSAVLTTERKAA